jgi:hypothetical protein
MKLSSPLVERTLNQIDAHAIPDGHPAIPKLNEMFGEHTFFLDDNGLNIVEPAAPLDDGKAAGQVVNLASWRDEDQTSLAPHEPEPTDILVELGGQEKDGKRRMT